MSNHCPNYCTNLHSHRLYQRMPSSKPLSTLDHRNLFLLFGLCYEQKSSVLFCFGLFFPDQLSLNIFSHAFSSFPLFFWVINTVLAPLPNIVLLVIANGQMITTVGHISFGYLLLLFLAVYLYLIDQQCSLCFVELTLLSMLQIFSLCLSFIFQDSSRY